MPEIPDTNTLQALRQACPCETTYRHTWAPNAKARSSLKEGLEWPIIRALIISKTCVVMIVGTVVGIF
jgi:hypothetical protein